MRKRSLPANLAALCPDIVARWVSPGTIWERRISGWWGSMRTVLCGTMLPSHCGEFAKNASLRNFANLQTLHFRQQIIQENIQPANGSLASAPWYIEFPTFFVTSYHSNVDSCRGAANGFAVPSTEVCCCLTASGFAGKTMDICFRSTNNGIYDEQGGADCSGLTEVVKRAHSGMVLFGRYRSLTF